MHVREGQVTPMHYHPQKMEDIINRGGGNLIVTLHNRDGDRLADSPVQVTLDGICRGIALLREWMATTILTVPADEHLIGGLEEHDLAGHLMSSQ